MRNLSLKVWEFIIVPDKQLPFEKSPHDSNPSRLNKDPRAMHCGLGKLPEANASSTSHTLC